MRQGACAATAPTEPVRSDALERELKGRHVQLIAIGGTIGVGLFLGSARAIQSAGPALLLVYGIGGLVVYFILRALGELLLYRPVTGSFATYAEEFVGPFAGFATAWSYWFMWIVVGMAEITAIGIYVHYWLPDVPQWIPALLALLVLYGMNMLAVRVFGEMEFWFALIKVATILVLIGTGLTEPLSRIAARYEHHRLSDVDVSAAVMLIGVALNYVAPVWFALLGLMYRNSPNSDPATAH